MLIGRSEINLDEQYVFQAIADRLRNDLVNGKSVDVVSMKRSKDGGFRVAVISNMAKTEQESE